MRSSSHPEFPPASGATAATPAAADGAPGASPAPGPGPLPLPGPVAVVGLGKMGQPMAAHLLAAGFAVRGYDVRADAITALASAGGAPAASPAEAADGAAVVITSLPSAVSLRQTVSGEAGLAAAARPGLIVVETSTLAIEDKEDARRALAAHGAVLLDCPLSGTASQMRQRDIAVYASGDAEAIERCLPVLEAFSRARYLVGDFGNGMRMKLVANHLVAVHNTAAAEALLLARRAGLDPSLALRALSDGAGNSRMLEVRGPMIVSGNFGDANITVANFQKDVDLIGRLARETGCVLPLFSAAAQLHLAAYAQGRLDDDPACVAAVLADLVSSGQAPAATTAPGGNAPGAGAALGQEPR